MWWENMQSMHNARIIQQGLRRHDKTLQHCNDGVSGTERVDEGTGEKVVRPPNKL